MRAKKSYGQHFLINESLAGSIVQSALDLDPDLPILEVGPGKGVLTKYLIESGREWKAVEADRDMIDYLYANFDVAEGQIIAEDFLKVRLEEVFDKRPFILLGNFPYNISSQIVFKAMKYQDLIPDIIGMFQKEMADRIIAPHGSKVYGAISVLNQVFYSGKTIFKVSPGSFNPPPKVQSSVIHLKRQLSLPERVQLSTFRTVVKGAFGQRRKMLRNTLKPFVKEKSLLESELFSKRPEQLSVEDFIQLTIDIQNQIE
jgi:16S rRNA (adenine1518-N6/adenine1519-N6)-dimethyltransferase